jgi:hypothetical protein
MHVALHKGFAQAFSDELIPRNAVEGSKASQKSLRRYQGFQR